MACGSSTLIVFSSYAESLKGEDGVRYRKKMGELGIDPYMIPITEKKSGLDCSLGELPNVGYLDVFHYLINSPCGYTGQAMKAYTSLDTYKYISSGWVRSVLVKMVDERFVITAEVVILLSFTIINDVEDLM